MKYQRRPHPITQIAPGWATFLEVPSRVTQAIARALMLLAIACLPLNVVGSEVRHDGRSPGASPAVPKQLELSTSALSDAARDRISGHIGNLRVKGLKTLSEEDAKVIASVRGPVFIDAPCLSVACAQQLSKHRGHMILSKLGTLSDAAAEALGRHHGDLCLFDCQTLSNVAVQHLAKGRATELGLSITDIDAEAARALANFKGRVEFFDLSRLDGDSAEALSSHTGELSLKVTDLTPAVAKALARKPGKLTLVLGRPDEPLKLTAETARELSRFVNGNIGLSNVAFEPSPEAVLDAFAGYRGDLSVALRDPLTDEAAQALGRLKGSLAVSLPEGSPVDPVRWLASHAGDLTIFGLTDCPLALAKALAEHRGGELSLDGMQQMSEPAAAALVQHAGPLTLTFRIPFSDATTARIDNDPPSGVVNMLCRHQGTLRIQASWVRADTIESILAHVGGLSVWAAYRSSYRVNVRSEPELIDTTWEWMPLDLFKRLATYPGPLRLSGQLTDEMAEVLAAHCGDLAVDPPSSEEVAKNLLRCDGRLFLGRHWTTETIASAKVFASEKNRTSVSTSSDLTGADAAEIASILVQRKGPLSLPQLQYVKAEALRILATKEDIRLPPLEGLYILADDGRDVEPVDVVSPEFLKKNAENQPPTPMPEWSSWEKLLSEHE